jgi:hypothetical protein
MSSTRPTLRLDEQSFQDLLAAAFTIQEHNTKRKNLTANRKLCGQCGSALPDGKDTCTHCASDPGELRTGERLQRNWASLWLMSQERGLQATAEAEKEEKEEVEEVEEFEKEKDLTLKTEAVAGNHFSSGIRISEAEEELEPVSDLISGLQRPPDIDPEEEHEEEHEEQEASVGDARSVSESEEDEALIPVEAVAGELATSTESAELGPRAFRWADLAVWKKPLKLRFDRSDFYLGLSIVVAAFALIWAGTSSSVTKPVSPAQHRVQLTLWEQALVGLGLAEAPDPPVYHGDPKVQVWVDPHTALYYCAGEEQYGKTSDGHFTSQREAQMDQFEPSERAACE